MTHTHTHALLCVIDIKMEMLDGVQETLSLIKHSHHHHTHVHFSHKFRCEEIYQPSEKWQMEAEKLLSRTHWISQELVNMQYSTCRAHFSVL